MGFNDQSQYPRGSTKITSLTNVAQEVSAGPIRVNRLIALGGAAEEIIILRNTAGTEFGRYVVAIGATLNERVEFWAADLEVITVSAAGDVTVWILHEDQGVRPTV